MDPRKQDYNEFYTRIPQDLNPSILTIFSMVMNAIQIFALVPENHDIVDMIKDMKGVLYCWDIPCGHKVAQWSAFNSSQ